MHFRLSQHFHERSSVDSSKVLTLAWKGAKEHQPTQRYMPVKLCCMPGNLAMHTKVYTTNAVQVKEVHSSSARLKSMTTASMLYAINLQVWLLSHPSHAH